MKYFFGEKNLHKILVFLCLLVSGAAHADNIDNMLQAYNEKNAPSQETIDENKGHLLLFTREKLEQMHAKTLKDILKLIPMVYYHENRYALPDPLTSGSFEPYKSNLIRLYIDGVEATQGWMGSGLMLYGDINIDFVSHVEVYYMTPSFETAAEPAYLTIFLYSKDPDHDTGVKVDISQGSRGYNAQSISYGEQKKDYSYMINFSRTDDERSSIDNGTATPLSRDFKRTQLFSYVKTDDQIFHLQLIKKDTDSLMGMSYGATPLDSRIDYLNVHADYGIDIYEHWRAQFAYDWLKSDMHQADKFPLAWSDALGSNIFYGEYKNSTYTAELTYTEAIGSHRLSGGLKGRYKKLDSLENFGQDALFTPFTEERIGSLFLQDQYTLSPQELLTFGISYNAIGRNGGANNDSLLQLRFGYLNSGENWKYKGYLFRKQFALEPLVRYLNLPVYRDLDAQTSIGVSQEFAYKNKNHHAKVMLLAMQDEDSLLQDIVTRKGENTKYLTAVFGYDYSFDIDNTMDLQLYYAQYWDIFNIDKLQDVGGYLNFTNSYGEFNFYNGVVWHRNSLDWKNYFDVTSTVSWDINEDLTFTIKGENLFDSAKETTQYTLNPPTRQLGHIKISPIDQRVIFELEYLF